MNRRTINIILKFFAALFVTVSIIMIVCMVVEDAPANKGTGLLVQSVILLLCSIWLCVAIYNTEKNQKD